MQQQKPLEGAQLVIMTIALSLATFMQVLDSTIANVAIPTIAGNLGSSLSQGTWVITSFGVANAMPMVSSKIPTAPRLVGRALPTRRRSGK